MNRLLVTVVLSALNGCAFRHPTRIVEASAGTLRSTIVRSIVVARRNDLRDSTPLAACSYRAFAGTDTSAFAMYPLSLRAGAPWIDDDLARVTPCPPPREMLMPTSGVPVGRWGIIGLLETGRDIEVTVDAWQGNGKRVERYRFVRTPPGCGPPLQLLDIRLGPERVFY